MCTTQNNSGKRKDITPQCIRHIVDTNVIQVLVSNLQNSDCPSSLYDEPAFGTLFLTPLSARFGDSQSNVEHKAGEKTDTTASAVVISWSNLQIALDVFRSLRSALDRALKSASAHFGHGNDAQRSQELLLGWEDDGKPKCEIVLASLKKAYLAVECYKKFAVAQPLICQHLLNMVECMWHWHVQWNVFSSG
ncbi:hypothetical protein RFI_21320 [Reticulomyxa filosa]|uniref:Uncharacterized protein n=1 Tax=Reticulomyxa filosa TaxID=46433 RepID=X6MQB9_RETFI|nr:hypothetical protein RFI_21320 [Reticulomyxa filosa]|eukprot:ETO16039.1 hypothetical protein RFI_21320 [Reticulomyxa filosa]